MCKDKDFNPDKFQNDLSMLNYFQEEYLYRHKHFWDILIKLFILVIVIAVLPIASEILGVKIDDIPQDYKFCFPILSFAISVFSLIILLQEADRLNRVGKTKQSINNGMPEKYRYSKKKCRFSLAYFIPYSAFACELIVIAICIIILCRQLPQNQ